MTQTNFFSLRSNKGKHSDSLKENSTNLRNKSTMLELSEEQHNDVSLNEIKNINRNTLNNTIMF